MHINFNTCKTIRMKKHLLLLLMLTFCAAVQAQTRVTIFGDSYSTYEGVIPSHYEPWYAPEDSRYHCKTNDVKLVEHTWWHQLINRMGWVLEKNDSWSGSTVGYFGYGSENYKYRSFNTRVGDLGEPDVILCLAGTNDSWTNEKVGNYKYANWDDNDLWYFRPAMARLMSAMKQNYPNARIYFILNTELREEINESVHTVCRHYGIPCIDLHDIDKQEGHPSRKGMTAICEQVMQAIK